MATQATGAKPFLSHWCTPIFSSPEPKAHKVSLKYTNGPSSVRRRPHFQPWISLKPVGQSWSNFMYSITGVGERMHKIWGQIGSNFWFPWQQEPPLTYNGTNNVSTFSRWFLIRSFLYLQITRTCIKSRTSSTFGQIGPLTTELAALERLKKTHTYNGKMVSPC